MPWYTHAQRDRSHFTHYGHRYGRHFHWSQTCCHSHCDRSSSSSIRYTLHLACATLWPMDVSQHQYCHDTAHTNSHTPSHTHHFHQCYSCHYSMDHSQSCPSNCHCMAPGTQMMRKAKPHARPSPPYIPPLPDCHRLGLPIRFFLRFRQWPWFFKLIQPPPSSDKDEWEGHFSSTHYTIGLVSNCPTVTVHAGKRNNDWLQSSYLISLYKCI